MISSSEGHWDPELDLCLLKHALGMLSESAQFNERQSEGIHPIYRDCFRAAVLNSCVVTDKTLLYNLFIIRKTESIRPKVYYIFIYIAIPPLSYWMVYAIGQEIVEKSGEIGIRCMCGQRFKE